MIEIYVKVPKDIIDIVTWNSRNNPWQGVFRMGV
jgi:hypothetical protein